MNALKLLTEQAYEAKKRKYPNVPEIGIVPPKLSDTTSNELTKCILEYFNLNGGYAVRINTQGQFNEKLKRFTKSTTKKGTADVHGVLDGIHYSIEIKIGRDKQSEYQEATQNKVETAGGYYFIAKNFQSFYDWTTATRNGNGSTVNE